MDVYATAKAFDTKHPNSSPKMYGDWLAVLQAVGAVCCMHAAPATGLVRRGCARQTVTIFLGSGGARGGAPGQAGCAECHVAWGCGRPVHNGRTGPHCSARGASAPEVDGDPLYVTVHGLKCHRSGCSLIPASTHPLLQ
jgi:hypothetical protein